MKISKDEIFVLLNEYALRNEIEINVEYPPLELNLFTLNIANFRITDIVSPKDFDLVRKKRIQSEFLRRDLPTHRDLLDVFLSSAILKFENEEEIEKNFKLLKESIRDRTMYVKPFFIGIDTNIAYYRIISRRLNSQFRYVISDIVVDEIDARIHTKYSGRMLREFSKLPYSKILMEFANASVKDARKAKNAMTEIDYMTNKLDAFRTGTKTSTQDKEVRDREIARDYRRFSKEINAEVILLTADKDMVFHASAEEISSIYFKLPHELYVDKVNVASIPYLFYDLVLVFGIVKINNTILLGEWRGKDVDDYFGENIKIYNTDTATAKDLAICRGVLDESP